MTEQVPSAKSSPENEDETFPLEPRYNTFHVLIRKIYDFLASAKVAMFLLVVILVCCVSGVTIKVYQVYRQGSCDRCNKIPT